MEPRGEITKALRAFRKDVGAISKNDENPFFKSSYASLSDIQNAIDPILDVHDLTLHCYFKELDNGTALMMDLYHESGEQMPTSEFRIRCKQTNTKVKDDQKGTVIETEVIDNPQDAGSGVTYAVRYCITVYLGLILGDDDDGNRASGNTQRRQQPTQDAPGRQESRSGKGKGAKPGSSAEEGMSGGTTGELETAGKAMLAREKEVMMVSRLSQKELRVKLLGEGKTELIGREIVKFYHALLDDETTWKDAEGGELPVDLQDENRREYP